MLSLAQVIQKYLVTYDSQNINTFILHLPKNKVIKFKQTPRGVYYHDMAERADYGMTEESYQDILTTAGQERHPTLV